jgi:hypothetical protein
MYKVVADENEVKWFYEYGIPHLTEREVHFLSVSFRNKVLTQEERDLYGLGRSEMCDKIVVRHDTYSKFLEALRRLEYNEQGSISKTGLPKPQKARRIYVNIVPIDAYNASKDLAQTIIDTHGMLVDSALKQEQKALDNAWYKIRKLFDSTQSVFARNYSARRWYDIDVDVDGPLPLYFAEELCNDLNSRLGVSNVMLVVTSGGFHTLIRRSALKCNPDTFMRQIKDLARIRKVNVTEVIHNTNEMIPMPGTWMGETTMAFVFNKSDFSPGYKFRHKEE